MASLAQTLAAESEVVARHHTISALTSVERVLAWINPDQGTLVTPDAQRSVIQSLIVAVSGLVLNYMNRDTLARTQRTEIYRSSMVGRIVLRHWPALSITSIRVSPATADVDPASYTLEPVGWGAQRVYGQSFPGDTTVVYDSGYVRRIVATVPSSGDYTVQAAGMHLGDEGVVDASGDLVDTTLYTVSASGLYTFDSSLAGDTVTIVYSYVPEDIEQVVVEETALAFKTRGRIGEQSKALPNSGGTVSYAPRALSTISKEALYNYRRVVPS